MTKPTFTPSDIPISALAEFENNSRTHTEMQVDKVVKSIKEFGFTNPVIVDETLQIIAGHCRVRAAQKMGLKKVPCITVQGWTEAQKRAYVIADNKLALDAGWDKDMLRIEFDDLMELEFDLALTGFDMGEVEDVLNPFGDETPSDGMPSLSDSEKSDYQQKTFILHHEQDAIVEDAISAARMVATIDEGLNDNNNANALTYICKEWLNAQEKA